MNRLLSTLSLFATAAMAFAQSPEMFNYQAVIRDGNGNLITNQIVDVRIGLYDGASMQYEEIQSVTADDYGLISVNVGSGNATSGTFNSLTWENIQYEMKVEVDAGSGYQNLGQAPLASVPYALHAESVPNLQLDGLSDVDAGSPGANEVLKWDGTNWTPQPDNAGSGSVWDTSGNVISYSAGNVGINTTSPSKALEVNGNVEFGDSIHFGSAELIYDGGAYRVEVNASIDPESDGFDDLGSPTQRWDDVYATNGTIQTSDRRDKTNIRSLDYGLEELMALNPVRFEWKDRPDQGDKLGLIAQDLQEVINEAVKDHDYERTEDGSLKRVENERLGVYYSDLIPVLIKAMQEQQKQIEALQAQNQEIEELKAEIATMKQLIKNQK